MNTQTQEALKCEVCADTGVLLYHDEYGIGQSKPCKACKEALAQPAQEPSELEMAGFELDGVIADGYREGLDNVSLSTIKRVRKTISDYVEQPAQEPVGRFFVNANMRYEESKDGTGIPLYTNPAPSSADWQGLSDDETQEIIDNLNNPFAMIRVAEIQLKEKNYGSF